MGVAGGPYIIKDSSLVLLVDAADRNSYPGSGTTWYDVSGNGNHATLYNGPTWNSLGYFSFDGSNDYADISLNLRNSDNTVLVMGRYTSATTGRILGGINNNYLCGTWSGYTSQFYAEGWISGPGGSSDTNWHIYHGSTNNGGTGTINGTTFYNNSIALVPVGSGAYGPNGIRIGSDGQYNEYAVCQVAYVAAWNRCLTALEVFQNFNVLKSRFSL
jgi:hypothetical protein